MRDLKDGVIMNIVMPQVALLDHMGSDLTIVNAARVSFAKTSTEFKENDKKLIAFLAKNGHWSPFAHCTAQFRIKAPIFVARQLVKHQVGLTWNETSRRYVDAPPEFFFPDEWRGKPVDKKQGSSGTVDQQWQCDDIIRRVILDCEEAYKRLLDLGVCPEQARMVLPLNSMTEWWWTGSLYAFARICRERLAPDAQQETKEVVQKISNDMYLLFPVAWEVLVYGKT